MQIESTRFGTLEVRDDTVLTFPDGLIGLPGRSRRCSPQPRRPRSTGSTRSRRRAWPSRSRTRGCSSALRGRVPGRGRRPARDRRAKQAEIFCVVQASERSSGIHHQPRWPADRAQRHTDRPPDHQRCHRVRCSAAPVRRGGAERSGDRAPVSVPACDHSEGDACSSSHASRRRDLHRRRHHRHGARHRRSTVRLGIEAPREIRIFREEIWLEIQAENKAAPRRASPTSLRPEESVVQHTEKGISPPCLFAFRPTSRRSTPTATSSTPRTSCPRPWSGCRPASGSTGPPTTPPAWRSRRSSRRRSAASTRPSATRRTPSRSCRPLKAPSPRCTRCCSASATSPCSSTTAPSRPPTRPRSRPRSRSSAPRSRTSASRPRSTASPC